jgi:flagellar basal-body rod protein FlgF
MASSLYVALSGQVAMERRLTTVANNVANMSTAGFRAEEVKFETLLSRSGARDVAFSSQGDSFISQRAGSLSYTGGSLDIATRGDAWFAMQTPEGIVYTRDGRLQMTEFGDLLSVDGHPVLDAGGAPLQVDPAGGPLQIGIDGGISQGDVQVGAVGLFEIPDTARLVRYGDTGVIPTEPAIAVEDVARIQVRQGYVEGANINPIVEITKLVMITRAFDSAAAAIEETEQTTDKAIQTLGPQS